MSTEFKMTTEMAEFMQKMGQEWNRPVDLLPTGAYRLDVPLKYKDGTERNQFVFVRIQEGFARGRDVYYVSSRAGTLSPGVNLYNVVKEAGLGVYSMITIIDDKDQNGNPCETILVQASPVVDFSNNYDLMRYVVEEVASVADYLESRYFGGEDKH